MTKEQLESLRYRHHVTLGIQKLAIEAIDHESTAISSANVDGWRTAERLVEALREKARAAVRELEEHGRELDIDVRDVLPSVCSAEDAEDVVERTLARIREMVRSLERFAGAH